MMLYKNFIVSITLTYFFHVSNGFIHGGNSPNCISSSSRFFTHDKFCIHHPTSSFGMKHHSSTLILRKSVQNNDNMIDDTSIDDDTIFDGKSTLSLISAQSLLVVIAIIAANILNVPNNGLGDGFLINIESLKLGVSATMPLFVLAFVLDFVEKKVPALQDVSKATQRSVLALLGGAWKPLIAIGVSILLGVAAGLGEEMLFRGVLQSELGNRFGDIAALTSSSVIFGALHAVTPLYALLASLASLYFGELYLQSHNLAVPIVCHGLYDVGALFAAHIQVNRDCFQFYIIKQSLDFLINCIICCFFPTREFTIKRSLQ